MNEKLYKMLHVGHIRDFVHSVVAHRQPFFKTGCPEQKFCSSGL